MMISYGYGALLFLPMLCFLVESVGLGKYTSKLPLDGENSNNVNSGSDVKGKRWAILIAGSRGYRNYRHQADVCHAYQILKKGGLNDDNIIVFMYDDIAFDVNNPRPGVIINHPQGNDVYEGVPKDYTGENVNVNNFLAVILGNKTSLSGGSGKVVDSGPDDHIFIYYSDHGSPGVLGMPTGNDLTAKDLVDILKKKHHARTYKSVVIYVEACESGSIFEGILPKNLNIWAITASNPKESSWAFYCPEDYPSPPSEYDTCLGDLFSISWLEDSEIHDLRKESLKQQYKVVRRRTAVGGLDVSSHVMQYGSKNLHKDFLVSYIGTDPLNDNYTFADHFTSPPTSTRQQQVNQRDADLLHFRHKYHKAPKGSLERVEAEKKLVNEISQRKHIDYSINRIAMLLFGQENGSKILTSMRSARQPLVDDWNCFKMLVRTFKKYCGSSSSYGMKYTGVLANMCNSWVNMEHTISLTRQVCSTSYSNIRSSLQNELGG